MEAREELARLLGGVLCGCRHELRRHDPEDARCDAPAFLGMMGCPCRCAHSPDPDRTLDEVRLDALLAHPDLVIAALGGELIPPMYVGMKRVGGEHVRYRFPVREGTDG